MYVCENCNNIIPYNDDGIIPDKCEFCGEPFDLEPARKCVVCGDWKHPNNMQSFGCCKECAEFFGSPETLDEYIKSEGKEAKADFYAFFLYDYDGNRPSDELVDLIERDFKTRSYEDKCKQVHEYFTSRIPTDFADWLEVAKKGVCT